MDQFLRRKTRKTIKDTMHNIHSIDRKQIYLNIIKYSPYFSISQDPKTMERERRLRCTHGEGRGASSPFL